MICFDEGLAIEALTKVLVPHVQWYVRYKTSGDKFTSEADKRQSMAFSLAKFYEDIAIANIFMTAALRHVNWARLWNELCETEENGGNAMDHCMERLQEAVRGVEDEE